MTGETIFRHYDRAALDAQYDNRAAVPEHVQHAARWRLESAAVVRELRHRLDLPYGPSAAETVDVFPAGRGAASPVQVYFHGGYWMSRDKADFRFLARAFVPAGAACVLVNYALVPTVNMDELVNQCRTALAWTWRNAASFGADPERIFISGHSAGGHLVAMMMATDWPAFDADLPPDLITGACAISGLYDLEPIPLCYLNETLNLSPGEAKRNSPMRLTPRSSAPLLLAYGDLESAEFKRQSVELHGAWRDRGVPCELRECRRVNHFTILDEFDRGRPLAQAVLAQMGLV
jgi:arylformamidase